MQFPLARVFAYPPHAHPQDPAPVAPIVMSCARFTLCALPDPVLDLDPDPIAVAFRCWSVGC